jgi:hypothetical protein
MAVSSTLAALAGSKSAVSGVCVGPKVVQLIRMRHHS